MRSNGIDRTHLEGNAVVLGAPRLPAGPRVPVPSGLSRRHVGPAHDRGNSAAYLLPNFHEKANPPRSCRAPRAGAAYQPAHVPHGHHAPLSERACVRRDLAQRYGFWPVREGQAPAGRGAGQVTVRSLPAAPGWPPVQLNSQPAGQDRQHHSYGRPCAKCHPQADSLTTALSPASLDYLAVGPSSRTGRCRARPRGRRGAG
jgi:hypothetical protein